MVFLMDSAVHNLDYYLPSNMECLVFGSSIAKQTMDMKFI